MATTSINLMARKSPLSMFQANLVKSLLEKHHAQVRVSIIQKTTHGDRIQDKHLRDIGGKELFTKELEAALCDNTCDIAVHSMKDVETHLSSLTEIPCILTRADARDAIVSNTHQSLLHLPLGATIGTSSLRRQVQLLKIRPDFNIVLLRGNVDTRLKNLRTGNLDAIILALAGIERLSMRHVVTEILNPEIFIPSVAQGAIGVQCRSEDDSMKDLLAPLNCPESFETVCCERAMLKAVGGNCHTPVGGYATLYGSTITLTAFASLENGERYYRVQQSEKRCNGVDLGTRLGTILRNNLTDTSCDHATPWIKGQKGAARLR